MFEPREAVDALRALTAAPDARGMLAQVEALERLKSATAAAQARITAEFDDLRLAQHPQHPAAEASLGAEVGIARHDSPHRGRRSLRLARALTDDLIHTMEALARGDISERRAEIIASGTSDLSLEDRIAVDAELAPRLGELGDRELQVLVQRIVYRIDAAGVAARQEQARGRRNVSSRRLGDGTTLITGRVADYHASAIMTSLAEGAAMERKVWPDDERTAAHVLADLYVERLTGQVVAASVPVHVDLVVTAETLFGDDDQPADIVGFGPVPASMARAMVRNSPEERTRLRRLFHVADTDRLVAMDSTSRRFTGGLRDLIRIRDQICRSPWCNAPIRHLDHIERVEDGGATSETNGQGLCEACNYLREAPGWRHRVVSEGVERHTVEITTPTGQVVRSHAPTPPRPPPEPQWVEAHQGHWERVA